MRNLLFALIFFMVPVFASGGREPGSAETGEKVYARISGTPEELFARAAEACAGKGPSAFMECVLLHKKAAASGWLPSMRALGNIYLHRDVFRENIGRYVGWYDFAAKCLGVFYSGCGVMGASAGEAIGWFSLAADKYGDPVSAYALGNIYSIEYFLTGSPEPDFAKAAEWYGKAARAGYGPALYALGDMCFNGKGARQDYGLAVQYFAAASVAGDADGAYMVGLMYYEGIGVDQNLDLAMEQLGLAAERGSGDASALLKKIRKGMK